MTRFENVGVRARYRIGFCALPVRLLLASVTRARLHVERASGSSPVPRHMLTNRRDLGLRDRRLVDHASAADDENAIGELEDLVEIGTDEQDRNPSVPRFE